MGKHALLRLYIHAIPAEGASFTLSDNAHHYLTRVMRARPGKSVYLFNNTDGEYRAEISAIDKRHTTLTVHERFAPPEIPPPFTVCLSPLKPEATRFAVQKITELGAAAFIPVICERTGVKALPAEKLQAIAAEAAEQCERVYVPHIHDPVSLTALIETMPENTVLIHADECENGISARETLALSGNSAYMIIGPEGGFSDAERALLSAHPRSYALSLGPRILKAETAAMAALITLQLHQGDWHEHPRYGNAPRCD